MLHGYVSFIVPRSIPEFYTTPTNGSSISRIFTIFFTIFFSVLSLFGLNQMFLMQELISCKHSDILVVINQLAEGHLFSLRSSTHFLPMVLKRRESKFLWNPVSNDLFQKTYVNHDHSPNLLRLKKFQLDTSFLKPTALRKAVTRSRNAKILLSHGCEILHHNYNLLNT